MGNILTKILLFPFQILLFPFKIIRDMFSSRQAIIYRKQKQNMGKQISKGERALKSKKLKPEDKKKIEANLNNAKKNKSNLRNWYKSSRRLEKDPDNMRKFRRNKRRERRLRKEGGKTH